jgi:hypothetical protein
MAVDEVKPMEVLHRPTIGGRRGLVRARVEQPGRLDDLAESAAIVPWHVEGWLRGHAAGGYVGDEPRDGTYPLIEGRAFALTNSEGVDFVTRTPFDIVYEARR